MTADELKTLILKTLTDVAPGIELGELEPDVSFHEQFDIDSMDYLNFVTALQQGLDVEIAGADYPKLGTLNGCLTYLLPKLGNVVK